jgi:4-hydroxy-4-methyl-2-oxoglutarate aldolase
MEREPLIDGHLLRALGKIETCMVSNAIEIFDVRLRNAGFADARIKCMFEDLSPMVGFAATARLRTGDPPMTGRIYHERWDWWSSILAVPAPRVVVLEDMDKPPGLGAFLGDMHAAILRALGCVGYVTDGAVRELPRIRETGFQVFAGNVAVSHAYSHIFDFGTNVKVGGLEIHPGDLLHGDRHGVLTIPKRIAAQIPAVATKLQQEEQAVIDFCQSENFSVEELRRIMNTQRSWQVAGGTAEKRGG